MADEITVGSPEIEEELGVDESTEEPVVEEASVEEETQEEEGTEEEKEVEEEQEEGPKLDASPTWKQINEKYPKLFKDFPGLKHTFFHAQEYRKIFPSVEDAQEAVEAVTNFRELEQSFTSGRVEDLSSAIKSFDGEVIANLGINFLPALKAANPDAYYDAITPELTNFCRTMYDFGVQRGDENIQNAALVASLHYFGNTKVATGEAKVATKHNPAPKDDKLEEERRNFKMERYTTLLNDVTSEANSSLDSFIISGLDPKKTMREPMREMLVDRIRREVEKVLSSDSAHKAKMNSLWRKAGNEGFSSSYKSKIVTAYLERAKELVPSIRSKVRSSTLGTRSVERDSNTNERREPQNTTGGGSMNGSKGKVRDPKLIDWSKTSDIDYMNGRITLKK